MSVRRLCGQVTSLVFVALLGGAGCSDRPNAIEEAPLDSAPSTRTVRMILPAKITPESEVWEQVAQMQVGAARLPMSVARPEPGAPASKQAEMIREVTDPSTILIVEPQDPQAIAQALEDVRARGVSIVLLDRPVPTAGKRIPVVEFGPTDPAVKAMVEESIKVAKQAGAPDSGPAQIFVPAGTLDGRSSARLAMLKDQLKAAGVTLLPDVAIGSNDDLAKVMREKLLSTPRPNLLFGVADHIVKSLCFTWNREEVGNLPVVGGYIADKQNLNALNYSGCVSIVDLNIRELARVAVDTALALADGQSVPDRIQVPVEAKMSDKGTRTPSILVRPANEAPEAVKKP